MKKKGFSSGAGQTERLTRPLQTSFTRRVPQTKCHWAHLAGSADRRGSEDQYGPICSRCTERLGSVERATWESRLLLLLPLPGARTLFNTYQIVGDFCWGFVGNFLLLERGSVTEQKRDNALLHIAFYKSVRFAGPGLILPF